MGADIDPNLFPSISELGKIVPLTTPTTPAISTTGASTIEASEQATEEKRKRDPAIPYLPFPIDYPDNSNLLALSKETWKMIAEVQSRCISFICDKWAESIKEIDEQKRAEEKARIRQGIESAFHVDHPAKMMAAISLLLLLAVTTPQMFGIGGQIGFQLIQNIQSLIMAAFPNLAAAQIGLLAGSFAAVMVYPATLSSFSAIGGEVAKYDITFAKSYAEQMTKLVKDPGFNSFISAMILGRLGGTSEISPALKIHITALIKLIMLFTALAAFYKIETRAITGQEMMGMLSGEIKLDASDARVPLITLIREQLELLPKETRVKLLISLQEYFDSKPEVDELLEPGRMLQAVFSDTSEYQRVSQEKG